MRVARPYSLAMLDGLPGLAAIDFLPPASGPEIELRFRLELEPAIGEEMVRGAVENVGMPVLAIRSGSPAQGMALGDPGWFAKTRLGRRLFPALTEDL